MEPCQHIRNTPIHTQRPHQVKAQLPKSDFLLINSLTERTGENDETDQGELGDSGPNRNGAAPCLLQHSPSVCQLYLFLTQLDNLDGFPHLGRRKQHTKDDGSWPGDPSTCKLYAFRYQFTNKSKPKLKKILVLER